MRSPHWADAASRLLLPTALLHLIGRDGLGPETLAGLAPAPGRAGEVAAGAAATPSAVGARFDRQVEGGGARTAILAAEA